MSADLTNAVFTNEEAALEHLEASRWPDGPFCPHCGSFNVHRMGGKTQAGMFLCNDCRDKFTARVGTVMERSHVPVHKWLFAIHLLTSSKKGMSAHQLHRMLGVTYKTAWFMMHRIREAMRVEGSDVPPIGGSGKVVEADETYIGKRADAGLRMSPQRKGRPYIKKGGGAHKIAVVALVERGGSARTFHVAVADKETVVDILRDNVNRESRLHTDESKLYVGSDQFLAGHESVRHTAKEYVRGDVHTNSVEGYFSIFKRGMKGVYQHCAEKHLHRYLAEFDFRYNNRTALGVNDKERAASALKGIEGVKDYFQHPPLSWPGLSRPSRSDELFASDHRDKPGDDNME
jgi:transposase-like protein